MIAVYKHEARDGYWNKTHFSLFPVRTGKQTLCGIKTTGSNWEELNVIPETDVDCNQCWKIINKMRLAQEE